MKDREYEYLKFEANVFGVPPLKLALVDVPSPEPQVKDFRRKKMMDAREKFLEDNDFMQRLVEYFSLAE